MNIDNGTSGRGKRAVNNRAASRLGVIGARGEKSRTGYRHRAGVREGSTVGDRSVVVEIGTKGVGDPTVVSPIIGSRTRILFS